MDSIVLTQKDLNQLEAIINNIPFKFGFQIYKFLEEKIKEAQLKTLENELSGNNTKGDEKSRSDKASETATQQ